MSDDELSIGWEDDAIVVRHFDREVYRLPVGPATTLMDVNQFLQLVEDVEGPVVEHQMKLDSFPLLPFRQN